MSRSSRKSSANTWHANKTEFVKKQAETTFSFGDELRRRGMDPSIKVIDEAMDSSTYMLFGKKLQRTLQNVDTDASPRMISGGRMPRNTCILNIRTALSTRPECSIVRGFRVYRTRNKNCIQDTWKAEYHVILAHPPNESGFQKWEDVTSVYHHTTQPIKCLFVPSSRAHQDLTDEEILNGDYVLHTCTIYGGEDTAAVTRHIALLKSEDERTPVGTKPEECHFEYCHKAIVPLVFKIWMKERNLHTREQVEPLADLFGLPVVNSKMKYDELKSCLNEHECQHGTTFGDMESAEQLESQDSNALTELMDKWVTLLSLEGRTMHMATSVPRCAPELEIDKPSELIDNESIQQQLDYCTKYNIDPKFWISSEGCAKGIPTIMEMVAENRLFKYHAAMRLYLKVEMEVENKQYSHEVGTRRIKAHFDEQYAVVTRAREELKKRLHRQSDVATQPWDFYLTPFS